MSRHAAASDLNARKALRDASEAVRKAKEGWNAEGVVLPFSRVSEQEQSPLVLGQRTTTETAPTDFASACGDGTPKEEKQNDTVADTLLDAAKIASSQRSNDLPVVRPSFDLLQQWVCTVIAIGDGEFVAIAKDVVDPARPDEEIVFDRDDINDADNQLLEIGAVFYWSVGYRISEWGQKTKGSELRFRRLPAWNKRELDAADKRAEELGLLFVENGTA